MSDTFGDRLRKIRKKFGLTQKAYGEKLGVSLPTVNRLEQSESWPHEDFLLRLRAEFNCDPTWILTGQGATEGRISGVNTSGAKRDHHVYTFLKSQRNEWLEIVACSEQIMLFAPEKERDEAAGRIMAYRDKIDYLDALLEVGRSEDEGNAL